MIFAIDVDGVIIDSKNQIIIDGFNAYREFFKDTKLFDNQKITLENYNQILKKHKKTVDKFQKLHVYSKTTEEILFNYYLIDGKQNIKNDKEYRDKLREIKKETRLKWHKELYVQRYKFQKKKGWQSIIKPFKETIEFIKRNKDNVIILSNKDKRTIKEILDFYSIPIDEKRLYTQDMTNDKNKKMKKVKEDTKTDYKNIIFIEDNFSNLKEAINLGVNCYMAVWGFNNKEQQKEAKKLGIKLLKLKDLSFI